MLLLQVEYRAWDLGSGLGVRAAGLKKKTAEQLVLPSTVLSRHYGILPPCTFGPLPSRGHRVSIRIFSVHAMQIGESFQSRRLTRPYQKLPEAPSPGPYVKNLPTPHPCDPCSWLFQLSVTGLYRGSLQKRKA